MTARPTSTAAEAVEAAAAAIARFEHSVKAWTCLDLDAARDEAVRSDSRPGPLTGIALGVKDIFDTADFPTEYGSPIFGGHRPRVDAGVVALLRSAGAVVLGKTVTTEFAVWAPGPTTNPHRPSHTPGGSSSGSAAAVATGMADVALGTQTAGSVIRPASFCGVYGFKPSYGRAPISGVKLVAPSLDTVGWFGRSVDVLDRVRVAVTGGAPLRARVDPPTIAFVPTDVWDDADDDSRAAVTAAAERAAVAGAKVIEPPLPEAVAGLSARQPVVMAHEAARSLASEHAFHREQLSAQLLEVLDWGARIDLQEYDDVLAQARRARLATAGLFDGAEVLLTPAVVGEAPHGLDATGDPRFCRLWTLLGLPAVTIPGFTGATGLPIGVQVIGHPGGDADVLAAAAWLAGTFPAPPGVPAPPGTT